MATRGDKKYLNDSIAFFMGWDRQISDTLREYEDKLTSSQLKRFTVIEKEIYGSVAAGNTERARERAREEEEIRSKYKGTEANRLQSLEMNLNIKHGERLVEAGNNLKQLCADIEAAAGIKSTPVSETVKKLSNQKMSKSLSKR
jgi:hypothetical protein